MKEQDVLRISDKVDRENSSEDEAFRTKLAREAWVLAAGLANGARDGVEEIIAEPGTAAGRLGVALFAGCLLGAGQRTAGLTRMGLEAVGVGMGVAFCRDLLQPQRWSDVRDALSGAWQSSANTDRSVALIGDKLGRFAFDTVLLSGLTLGAAKFGQNFLADIPSSLGSFESGYVSSYDRMILDKMNRTHPY